MYTDNNIPRADGSTATYTCATGYQVTGLMVRTCSVSGWSTGGDPVCTGEGDECICDDSVFIVRPPTAICPGLTLTNGFIGYSPISTPILEGAIATHSCTTTGYQLSSSTTTRTCQSDRTWSGISLICEGISLAIHVLGIITPSAVDCGPLTITNGAVDTSSGTTFMMTATYTCNTGYILTGGSMTRTCPANMMWSGSEPTCDGEIITR